MKPGWDVKALGEVCDVLDSKRKPITKRDRIDGPYPYYGATGVLGHVDGYLFDEPLVLLGEDGAKWGAGDNSAFSVEGKVWVNNHAHVLRPNRTKLLDAWLIYFLNFSDLSEFISGMTVPKLNQGMMNSIPIPLPPLDEQKRIVEVLDAVFEGLSRARAHTETNLQNARELFEQAINEVFGEAGSDWEHKTVSECFRLKSGDGLTSSAMKPGQYPVFGGNGVAGTHDQFNLTGENVIIGRVGALCGNARKIEEKIWLTDNAFKVVDLQYDFDIGFLTRLLNAKNLRQFARQTAQPVISNSSLKDLPLSFPRTKSRQVEIARKLENLEEEVCQLQSHYRAKLADLDALRQALLQKAFAGELT